LYDIAQSWHSTLTRGHFCKYVCNLDKGSVPLCLELVASASPKLNARVACSMPANSLVGNPLRLNLGIREWLVFALGRKLVRQLSICAYMHAGRH
jgi:hypothetical protein